MHTQVHKWLIRFKLRGLELRVTRAKRDMERLSQQREAVSLGRNPGQYAFLMQQTGRQLVKTAMLQRRQSALREDLKKLNA